MKQSVDFLCRAISGIQPTPLYRAIKTGVIVKYRPYHAGFCDLNRFAKGKITHDTISKYGA